MVALGTAIAFRANYAVLARTLAARLVADLAAGAYWVTVAGPAGLLVRHWLVGIAKVSLLTVVTVTAGCVVAALVAHTARHTAGQAVQLHVKAAATRMLIARAGHTLISSGGGGPAPGPVKMKRFALLTLSSISVVLAVTGQLTVLVQLALGGMAVALAPPPDGQIGDADVLAGDWIHPDAGLLFSRQGVGLIPIGGHHNRVGLDPLAGSRDCRGESVNWKDNLNVGGRDPVLQDGTVLKVLGAGPALQGGEGHPAVCILGQV